MLWHPSGQIYENPNRNLDHHWHILGRDHLRPDALFLHSLNLCPPPSGIFLLQLFCRSFVRALVGRFGRMLRSKPRSPATALIRRRLRNRVNETGDWGKFLAVDINRQR